MSTSEPTTEPTTEQLAEFLRGYLTAALWSTNDESAEGGEPLDYNYDSSDIAPQSEAGVKELCRDFMTANYADLLEYAARRSLDPSQGTVWDYAGHDLWLNAARHGVGFWDRGLGELGDRLSEAAKLCSSPDLYVGDDGVLYFMGYEEYKP